MQFQFDMSSNTLPATAGTSSTEALTGQMVLGVLQQMLDVQKQAFQEMINIQREQLNAIEEGETYRRLLNDYGHTQEDLGKIVGKSRSHIANLVRLRDLPQRVQDWLGFGQISMGHARALLTSDDPEGLAKQVIAKGLSVRQTEALARRMKAASKPPRAKASPASDADIQALERQLADLLGLKVGIRHEGKSGQVTLAYSSLEQLDMICQRLSGEPI